MLQEDGPCGLKSVMIPEVCQTYVELILNALLECSERHSKLIGDLECVALSMSGWEMQSITAETSFV